MVAGTVYLTSEPNPAAAPVPGKGPPWRQEAPRIAFTNLTNYPSKCQDKAVSLSPTGAQAGSTYRSIPLDAWFHTLI